MPLRKETTHDHHCDDRVKTYRLYSLEGTGQIGYADWLDAIDDQDAIKKTRHTKKNAIKCEIWEGSRLVVTLNEDDLKAPE